MQTTATIARPSQPQYGRAYQEAQASKYRQRHTNHWQTRIDLAFELVHRHVVPRLGNKRAAETRVIDVGCSIGTFAIEFAKRGFDSVGIDLDAEALSIAAALAHEERVSPEFICADLAQWDDHRPIDIAVAFDIFEHLHDDQMGAMLSAIRRRLSQSGALVFHTFPTEFEFIFFEGNGALAEPLLVHADAPPAEFERRTRALAARLDADAIERTGRSHSDAIRLEQHCNPTTPRRLGFLLQRAGFNPAVVQTAQLYEFSKPLGDRFKNQPIVHRNLFGVAFPMESHPAQ